MLSHVKYTAIKGIPWERLVIVRDRRTHRVVRPIDCWARVRTGTLTVKEIHTQVTSEGGILLTLSAAETQDLPVGDLEFDVMATTYKTQSLVYGSLTSYAVNSSGETITQPVVKGTISVSALDTVTSLEENSQMEIRFKKGEDFRIVYSWTDDDDAIVSVKDAYMQAKDVNGATVLDIRWFAAKPSENTIIALPGNRRGYFAPFANATMELHISDSNSITAGEYTYDIFVQESDDDWKPLAAGTLVVEASVSTRPS